MKQVCYEVEKGPRLHAVLSLGCGRGDGEGSCEIGPEVGRGLPRVVRYQRVASAFLPAPTLVSPASLSPAQVG